jgi:integrase
MARSASLKPHKTLSRQTAGKAFWCVDVPPHLSGTNKRQQLFFWTEKEAKAKCEELKARRDNLGTNLANVSAPRLLEAEECRRLLEEHPGISLRDAVHGFLEIHQTRVASIPFGELFQKFIDSKAKKSLPYLNHLRWAQKQLAGLNEILASDLTVRKLDETLQSFRPTVRNAFQRYLRAALNWGTKRNYLPINPAVKLDFEEVVNGETEIFEPDIVAAILKDCMKDDLALLPYRIFGFFCGVRPHGELTRVEWEDFDWNDKILTLRAEITKKKRRRFIDVSDNALAWLREYRRRGGKTTGLIVPFGRDELRKRHRANWGRVVGLNEAGRPKVRWIQQGMRHSFCSYWLVTHDHDTDGLVIQSGHESKEVMWDSYYRATTKAKAAKFWALMPPKGAKNIIPFEKTANG